MDYKIEQKRYREMSKPKDVKPEDYTEFDKKVMSEMTAFYSRKQRRKKVANPKYTKKRHKRK